MGTIRAVLVVYISSFAVTALAEQVKVGDQLFDLEQIEYRADGTVDNAKLIGEHKIQLNPQNQIELSGNYVWFFNDGKLRWVTSPGAMNWQLPDETSITLDCRDRYVNGVKERRIVSFYNNGNYERGCDALSQKWFKTEKYAGNVRFGSALELWRDGSLKYASRVSEDSSVTLFGNPSVNLNRHSELAVYENGKPYFFTINPDNQLLVSTPNAGPVYLGTNPSMRIAVILREDGTLSSGGPTKVVSPRIAGKTVRLQVEAIRFYKNHSVGLMIMQDEAVVPVDLQRHIIPLRMGRKALCLSKEGQPIGQQACQEEFR